jgi:hypothetical protein
MEWDPNMWQGRSKRQVENNNKVAGYAVIAFMVCIIVLLIWDSLRYL